MKQIKPTRPTETIDAVRPVFNRVRLEDMSDETVCRFHFEFCCLKNDFFAIFVLIHLYLYYYQRHMWHCMFDIVSNVDKTFHDSKSKTGLKK